MNKKGKNHAVFAIVMLALIFSIFFYAKPVLAGLFSDNIDSDFNLGTYFQTTTDTGNLTLVNDTDDLLLWMKFDIGTELTADSDTVLLMHFNNDSSLGENDTFFVDSSDYGNNGTCSGTACPAVNLTDYKLGRAALTFDSVDDHVNIPDHAGFNFGANGFGIEMWAKFDAVDLDMPLYGQVTDADNRIMFFHHRTAGFTGYVYSGGPVAVNTQEGTPNIANGTWYHIVWVRNGNNWNIYKDGVSIAATTDTDSVADYTYGPTIGTTTFGTAINFSGTIDEVAIWNRSLSAGELAVHSGYSIDSSSFANNATFKNGTIANITGCLAGFNECLIFDGIDDYVNISNDDSLNLENDTFTIEAWINSRGSDTGIAQTIISKWRGGFAGQPGYRFEIGTPGKLGLAVNGGGVPVGNTVLSNNTWYHAAVVFNGTGGTYYLNGIDDGTGTSDSGSPDKNGLEVIAGGVDGGNDGIPDTNWFDGFIDGIRIYNRTLSASEISGAARATSDKNIFKAEGNFTSQIFDASSAVSWQEFNFTETLRYSEELQSDEIDSDVVLAMHFNNITEEQLIERTADNDTVLLMHFNNITEEQLIERTADNDTVLLMHFNNDSAFGENDTYFYDFSDNNNNGTCDASNNCTVVNTTSCLLGSCVTFDGDESGGNVNVDYIKLPENSLDSLNSGVFLAWIYLDTTGNPNNNIIAQSDSGGVGFRLSANKQGMLTVPSNNGFYAWNTVAGTINNHTWTHVAWAVDSNGQKAYVDGQRVNISFSLGSEANTEWFNDLAATYSGYWLGAMYNTPSEDKQPFRGNMDEVIIYNRTLSASEIEQHAGAFVSDSSNYGNNGTKIGNLFVDGKFNAGLEFNGVNNYVNLSTPSSLMITGSNPIITSEAWVKVDDYGNHNIIYFYGVGTTSNMYQLYVEQTTGDLQFALYGNDHATSTPVSTGVWHHVANTLSGTSSRLYLDGVLISSATLSAPNILTGNALIGNRDNLADHYFDGTIDEVAIWNISLSADTISEHAGAKIIDYSQYGNNGTRIGNISIPEPLYVDARFGAGLEFDGIDDHINISDDNSLSFPDNSFSVEAWIKTLKTSFSYIARRESGSAYFYLATTPNNARFRISDVSANDPLIDGSTIINDGNWHHLVGVRNISADSLYIYVDGVQEGSTTDTTTASTATINSLTLGTDPGVTGNFFNGTIDEVRIYNKTLTASEIQEQYIRGIANLTFQFRSCDDSACSGESFVGPNNSSDTFFTSPNISLNTTIVPGNRYFQYLASLSTEDTSLAPFLENASMIYNTCTYYKDNWIIDLNDNCTLAADVVGQGERLDITGRGALTLEANISNFSNINIKGGDSSIVTCREGCFIK